MQVFFLFYVDGRPHFKRFHEEQQDKNVTVEPWIRRDKGFTRTNRFNTPLRGLPMGPPETRCEETSWYSLTDNTLTVDTVQVSLDIPYNDYFTVETRWIFKLVDGGNTEVTASCGVHWIKKTLMKGAIESTTVSKCKGPNNAWVEYMANQLQEHPNMLSELMQAASAQQQQPQQPELAPERDAQQQSEQPAAAAAPAAATLPKTQAEPTSGSLLATVSKLLPEDITRCVVILLLVVELFLVLRVTRELRNMNTKLDALFDATLQALQAQPAEAQNNSTEATQL